MTFTTPLFLLGLAAAGIPVALHLISRRTRQELPFPTLRFIRISEQKTRRRRRIQDLLLLLLRMTVFMLLALALAGPTLRTLQGFFGVGDGKQTAMAIILDNSPSMQMTADGVTRLDAAKMLARQILDPLDPNAQIAVFLTAGTPFPDQGRLMNQRESIDGMIEKCSIGGESPNLPEWVRRATQLLAGSRASNRIVVVISDQRAAAWNFSPSDARRLAEIQKTPDEFRKFLQERSRSSTVDATNEGSPPHGETTTGGGGDETNAVPRPWTPSDADSIPILLVRVGGVAKPDAAIRETRMQQAVPLPNLPMELTVRIAETSGVEQDRFVELWIDGERTQTSPALPLDAYGTADWTVSVTFPRGGEHRGEVRLTGEDGAKIDDSRYFTATIAENIPIGILTARRHEIESLDAAFYLERALRPTSDGWSIRPTRFTWNEITAGDLSPERFPIFFCVDLPAPEPTLAAQLKQYLLDGGQLVWISGDAVDPGGYAAMQAASGDVLLPVTPGSLRIAAAEFSSNHASAVSVSEPSVIIPTVDGTSADESDAVSDSMPVPSNVPGTVPDSWNIAWVDADSPIFRGLTEPVSLYQSVLVYRTMGVRPADGDGNSGGNVDATGARTLARLSDDTPLLIERSVGSRGGRTLFWSGGMQLGWTNLPLKKIFPAMILRLVADDVSVAGGGVAGMDCGSVVTRTEPPSDEPKQVEVIPPRGDRLRFPMRAATMSLTAADDTTVTGGVSKNADSADRKETVQQYTFTRTSDPGFYRFQTLGAANPKPQTIAVNIPSSTMYPSPLPEPALEPLLAPNPVLSAGSVAELTETLRKLHEGTNLGDPLLYAVFFALIAEALVANRRGGREEEPLTGPAPTERTLNSANLATRRF